MGLVQFYKKYYRLDLQQVKNVFKVKMYSTQQNESWNIVVFSNRRRKVLEPKLNFNKREVLKLDINVLLLVDKNV